MRAILCGANGAVGRLLRKSLDQEAVGLVSLDGAEGVAKTFRNWEHLRQMWSLIFPITAQLRMCWSMPRRISLLR